VCGSHARIIEAMRLQRGPDFKEISIFDSTKQEICGFSTPHGVLPNETANLHKGVSALPFPSQRDVDTTHRLVLTVVIKQ
jgi:hypothetical protein